MASSRRRNRCRRPAGCRRSDDDGIGRLSPCRAHRAWWWLCVSVGGLAILLMLVNRLLLPTITGWSLGRALFGIAVVRRDGEATGPWGLLLRDLAHLLDTASVVGWLWPLWDSRRRTFADMLLRTEVRRVEPDKRAAQHTAVDRGGGAGRGGNVPGRRRRELCGGVLPGAGDRSNSAHSLRRRGRRSSHRC